MAYEKVIYDVDNQTTGSWLTSAETVDCGNNTMLDDKLDSIDTSIEESKSVPLNSSTLTGDASVTLSPNAFYNFGGTPSTITVALTAPESGTLGIYAFQFNVGTASTFELGLPNNVTWGTQPEFEDNTTYQVTIVNNIALYCAG